MKYKKVILRIIIFFLSVGILYYIVFIKNDMKKDSIKKDIAIDTLINNLKGKVIMISDIYLDENYSEIVDSPLLYKEDIINFLKKSRDYCNIDLFDRTIVPNSMFTNFEVDIIFAVLSMQKLDIDSYLEMANIVTDIYFHNCISDHSFYFVFIGYEDICLIKNNKHNPKIEQFIKKIIHDQRTSNNCSNFLKEAFLLKSRNKK